LPPATGFANASDNGVGKDDALFGRQRGTQFPERANIDARFLSKNLTDGPVEIGIDILYCH